SGIRRRGLWCWHHIRWLVSPEPVVVALTSQDIVRWREAVGDPANCAAQPPSVRHFDASYSDPLPVLRAAVRNGVAVLDGGRTRLPHEPRAVVLEGLDRRRAVGFSGAIAITVDSSRWRTRAG